ncbi:hypothetical protein GmRootV59_05480 [Variovorax sp. V59]
MFFLSSLSEWLRSTDAQAGFVPPAFDGTAALAARMRADTPARVGGSQPLSVRSYRLDAASPTSAGEAPLRVTV